MKVLRTTDFQLAPVGTYRGVLCDVIDMGERENTYNPGEMLAYVQFAFQTEHLMPNGKPYVARTFPMTQKFPGNSKLTKFGVALRGRKFTKEEEEGFDFDDLIGTNAIIEVTHNIDKNGKPWANVVKVAPLPEGTEPSLKVTGSYVRVQDWERNSK
jgi:hypothetical protein